jgi:hypothetical protein
MSRARPDTGASKAHLTHSVEGIDLAKALGLVTDSRPAAEPTPVAEPVDLGSKDTETVRELFRANPPSRSEPEPELVVEEPAQPNLALIDQGPGSARPPGSACPRFAAGRCAGTDAHLIVLCRTTGQGW